MKYKVYVLLGLGLLLGSCSTVAYLPTDDEKQTYAATDPDRIEVYSTDEVGKPYMVIGEVVASADAGLNAAISVDYLKEEAAKLGADGIINLRLEIGMGYWTNGIEATGTAVKYIEQ